MTAVQTIAHYRITGKLGEGGMGAVYRATDTKLGRDVAIKVLPEAFASDPDRMARLNREAQVLASLNHPNIAAIYGIEDGALVMELIDGADLHGPVPLDTAVNYARQIAAALEAAHEKGIVHRDLKPANIKVTPEGTVKLLDFGLAKVAEPIAASANSPTLTIHSSQAGMVMGTVAYMAPEQARGQPVDKRADIWAFGVVLWEMLTGKQMFAGETVSDVLASVLKSDPDLDAAPPQVRRLLARCLERDPRKRLRDIGVWPDLLEERQVGDLPHKRNTLPWVIAAVAVVGALVSGAVWLKRPVEEPRTLRFTIPPPDKAAIDRTGLAASPDGRRIAFVARQDGVSHLWLRDLDAQEARALPEPTRSPLQRASSGRPTAATSVSSPETN